MKPEYYIKHKTMVIEVGNELDHHNADAIRLATENYICKQNIRHLVFDFQRTNFMDSSGIGILIGRFKVMKEIGGGIAIANVNRSIERMFLLSGIYKIIQKYDSVDEAIRKEEK